MRSTGRLTGRFAIVALLGVGLAGCSGDAATPGGTSSSGSPSGSAPSATSSGSAAGGGGTETGSAASCLVGTWKASGLNGKLGGTVSGEFTGGGGATLTIDSAGKTQVGFDGMQPVTFTFKVADNDVKGSFGYGGKVNGTVKTPSGATGTWEPTGTVDFSTLTVTVDLTAPASLRVADKVKLSEFAGAGTADTGGAVDAQPILKKGTYDCSGGSTLKLGPAQGGPDTGTWTFTKS